MEKEYTKLMWSVFLGDFNDTINILKANPLIDLMQNDRAFFRELGVYRPGEIETRKIWDFLIRNFHHFLDNNVKYGYEIIMFRRIILDSKL